MNWSLIEMEEETVEEVEILDKMDKELDKVLEQMAADINCNRMKARPRFKKKIKGE